VRTRPLLRKSRHRAMMTPVSLLHTGLIRISPSYWTNFCLKGQTWNDSIWTLTRPN